MEFDSNRECVVKKLALLLLCSLIGCGEYPMYGILWQDFNNMHMKAADADENGVTTSEELQAFKTEWLKKNNFTLDESSTNLYDKDGNLLSANEIYNLFPQCFQGKNPHVCGGSAN
jgi:hypothetical protein